MFFEHYLFINSLPRWSLARLHIAELRWSSPSSGGSSYSDRHYSDKQYSDVHYCGISKVYWCRSSSPSPVCFNIDGSTQCMPSTSRSTLGDRAFPVAAARAWNALPSSARAKTSLQSFRRDVTTAAWGWHLTVDTMTLIAWCNLFLWSAPATFSARNAFMLSALRPSAPLSVTRARVDQSKRLKLWLWNFHLDSENSGKTGQSNYYEHLNQTFCAWDRLFCHYRWHCCGRIEKSVWPLNLDFVLDVITW